ncbi:MAG TPA: hypothetical protein VE642_12470 [Pyrinomonadaceae bacterium]|jgi:hypothetical protein|nr:hypothetical protein [Pyrinomonadaceae bacterium]
MSKGLRLSLGVLAAFLCLSFLHVWLNIGFDKFGLFADKSEEAFRVGFLPVT